jgi:hypothetical protein
MFEYILYVSRRGEVSKPLQNMLSDFRKIIAELLEAAHKNGEIKKDIDCKIAAATFAAWFDGAPLHAMILKKPSMDEMARNYISWFIQAIKPCQIKDRRCSDAG